MRETIPGRSISLRLVRPADAPDIIRLRTDPDAARFLSPTDPDADKQRQWIEAYLERERAGTEFYFMICHHSGESIGTIRLYDFRGDSFGWGSWILSPGQPWNFAPESFFLAMELGFGELGFRRSHFQTRVDNRSVAGFFRRMGACEVAVDAVERHFELTADQYRAARGHYSRFLPEPAGEAAPLRRT